MSILWRIVALTPHGIPQIIEFRAASERIAIDKFEHFKPEWAIQSIERRPPPVSDR
jgi:hypothetical protein